jgi:DNA-binding transcriptional LysR family regulator
MNSRDRITIDPSLAYHKDIIYMIWIIESYTVNLHHLAVFHAVAEEGSVSKGAQRLLVSQPAVSKQIRDFERSLKTALFDRLPRGLRLTEAGKMLAEHARRIFAATADAERALDELNGLVRGRLAVGASTTIGVYMLPDLFMRFRQAHPAIDISLALGTSDGIQELLLTGAIDIGLTEAPVASDSFESAMFMEDELVAIAPPGHALARKRKITAEMICREPFVVRETGSQSKSLVERTLADRGLSVRPTMSLGSTEAIKRAVAAGLGVAIVSRLTVGLEQKAGRLTIVRVADLRIRRPLYKVILRGSHASRSVAAFGSMLNAAARPATEKFN